MELFCVALVLTFNILTYLSKMPQKSQTAQTNVGKNPLSYPLSFNLLKS